MLKIDAKIFWWVWSSIPKVPKIASLQCLYNISKKKLWMEFFMKFIKIKISTSWIINFWWKPNMPKVPEKGSLLSFCKILRKSITTVFVFYCEAKTFRYFTGFQSCLLLLVFANIQTPDFCQDTPGFWCCPGVPDWISLSWFLYFLPKKCSYLHNFSSAV